ncbi:type II secretion system GspH family protein [Candidatus Parcubacteria bacterium]|nr:type II secretion system GspH family protein [Candidatus Parcubacteria bacterium]
MKKEKGFTLIELMTAVSVFVVIMTVSMGAILGVFEASRKTRSIRVVLDNLDFAMEAMTREMRYGKNYHCESDPGASPPFTSVQNCGSGGKLVSFLSSDNIQIAYRIHGTTLEKSEDGGATYISATSPEVTLNSSSFFYVTGAVVGDPLQPRTLIKMSGTAGTQQKTQTDFTLQTLVSQRALDIP